MKLTNKWLNSSKKWCEKITEREFHGKPEGRWIITGWYWDERRAYYIAKAEWEKRQQEGWAKNPEPFPTLEQIASGEHNLLPADDYFHWNVETPHWYLHKNGTWHKLLCGDRQYGRVDGFFDGEFPSRESAEEILRNTPLKPPRFERYQEHLDNAEPPISCR